MQDYWIEFGKVAVAHLLAVMSPGPDFAVILRQSLGYGRRVALWTSLGIGAAILVHVTYSMLGVGLVLRDSATWFNVLKYACAAYLGWLGLRALRAGPPDPSLSAGSGRASPPLMMPAARSAFFMGFLTNVLNPKAALFFIALFATLVSANTPRTIKTAYGVWMAAATVIWFSIVALVASRDDVRRGFLRHGHWVSRALGIVLVGLAVSIALARVN